MFEHLAGMSLESLRVFEAAARLRGFTAAALELGTTQPAVSQQVKRLEAQLGTRLFDRIYRGIALTDAGQSLFEQVHQGLQAMKALPRPAVAGSARCCRWPPTSPLPLSG